ncbi:GNAT family N-acetyltransferase [Roseateles oligotrophus]|uniref:GNAT family N-acetyltransferase n=1 Tax=Roseateles oligotrophus TaxID=1769250 RepID=A0ABT2YI38_9BURK|nr:GNAT family N-acetyltransferase [Roseateles oligotrophus]MCV2369740.1 GNAT family N-acetyltransferase [Roseateles oligotrophus]
MKTITIRLLTLADCPALLDFETRNRGWFEQHVAPRGEAFYSQAGVLQHIAELLAAHAQGRGFPGLLLDETGLIIGRINLKDMDLQTGVAELGYRLDQDRVGAGLATAAVRQMKALAQRQLGLQRLDAVVSPANPASARVLQKCGFERLDPAASAALQRGDSPLIAYRCRLDRPAD